jgi:hypothetical protein
MISNVRWIQRNTVLSLCNNILIVSCCVTNEVNDVLDFSWSENRAITGILRPNCKSGIVVELLRHLCDRSQKLGNLETYSELYRIRVSLI